MYREVTSELKSVEQSHGLTDRHDTHRRDTCTLCVHGHQQPAPTRRGSTSIALFSTSLFLPVHDLQNGMAGRSASNVEERSSSPRTSLEREGARVVPLYRALPQEMIQWRSTQDEVLTPDTADRPQGQPRRLHCQLNDRAGTLHVSPEPTIFHRTCQAAPNTANMAPPWREVTSCRKWRGSHDATRQSRGDANDPSQRANRYDTSGLLAGKRERVEESLLPKEASNAWWIRLTSPKGRSFQTAYQVATCMLRPCLTSPMLRP